jgi:hypothetical protein
MVWSWQALSYPDSFFAFGFYFFARCFSARLIAIWFYASTHARELSTRQVTNPVEPTEISRFPKELITSGAVGTESAKRYFPMIITDPFTLRASV